MSLAFLGHATMAQQLSRPKQKPVNASKLPKPPQQVPSEEAKKEAHDRVENRKYDLETKIREGKSPQEIGKAKAQLQTDRTESNRQDYFDKKREEQKTE
ncbi:hypothetical protein [Bdellovibrio sp. ArHS]|uniref:hypothetical protein n=1 Tax=Bdellovibrio sp. ArHS TaxID=1569284 RepID=UPI0025B940F2|nr:hypothetical protein [Bdellovibrio sp. ArHS]